MSMIISKRSFSQTLSPPKFREELRKVPGVYWSETRIKSFFKEHNFSLPESCHRNWANWFKKLKEELAVEYDVNLGFRWVSALNPTDKEDLLRKLRANPTGRRGIGLVYHSFHDDVLQLEEEGLVQHIPTANVKFSQSYHKYSYYPTTYNVLGARNEINLNNQLGDLSVLLSEFCSNDFDRIRTEKLSESINVVLHPSNVVDNINDDNNSLLRPISRSRPASANPTLGFGPMIPKVGLTGGSPNATPTPFEDK
ncbi:hypothetical protein PCE1_002720 [Barthelona sp. PCE]